MTLDGENISKHCPRDSLDAGIGYIPEDRSHDGYVGAFSVRENLVLDLYHSDEFARGPALRLDAIASNAKRRIKEFDIRTETMETPVSSLSGGNQQKVVVAREFSRPLKVLIASQPTRGVDVGSIEFIHKRIIEERDRGTAVIIVSTELDEVFALVRPDRRDVRRPHRRHRHPRHHPRGDRPDDGRRPRRPTQWERHA